MSKGRIIKTVVCLDWMGCGSMTADEEFEEIKTRFQQALKPHTLVITRAHSTYAEDLEDAELVLFDFGGVLPGTDMPERNASALARWAEDHPGSLIVILSSWTYDHLVRPIMGELELDNLPNVVLSCAGNSLPEWFTAPKQEKHERLTRVSRRAPGRNKR